MSIGKKLLLSGLILVLGTLTLFGISASPASAQGATATPVVVVITATPSTTPPAGVVVTTSPTCPYAVVVKAGDDLYRISLAANTSWPILAALNHIANPNLIFVGETLCVPAPVATVTPSITTTPDLTQTAIATLTGTPVPTTTPAVLPTNTTAATLTPTTVAMATTTYPQIALNTYQAGAGDTVVITGVNFTPSSPVDLYLTLYNPANPGTPTGNSVASTTSAGDGSLSVNFTIPAGTYTQGQRWTITARNRANGFFGYTTYTDNK